MTCIIGIADGKNVWMGGDSCSISGLDYHLTKLSKVFICENFLIGYTTSFRMGQILQYHVDWKALTEQYDKYHDNILSFMIVHVVEELREKFKTKGFTRINDNTETSGQFLIGFQGELFRFDNDFQVNTYHPLVENFVCITLGCGADYALGALFALKHKKKNVRKNIQLAMATAEACSAGVKLPATILKIKREIK